MKRHLIFILSSVLLAGLFATSPASSQVFFGIGVRIGPPPVRYERVGPPPFAHAVWVRGYWAWNRGLDRYVWCSGRWIAPRPGYAWHDGFWQRSHRAWAWRDGWWERRHEEMREHRERDAWRYHDGHGYGRDRREREDR